jgi:hypothetical protein
MHALESAAIISAVDEVMTVLDILALLRRGR